MNACRCFSTFFFLLPSPRCPLQWRNCITTCDEAKLRCMASRFARLLFGLPKGAFTLASAGALAVLRLKHENHQLVGCAPEKQHWAGEYKPGARVQSTSVPANQDGQARLANLLLLAQDPALAKATADNLLKKGGVPKHLHQPGGIGVQAYFASPDLAKMCGLTLFCGDGDLAYGQTPPDNYSPEEADEFLIDPVVRNTKQRCAGCGQVVNTPPNRTLPNIHLSSSRVLCHVLIDGARVSETRANLGLKAGECFDCDFDTTNLGDRGGYMLSLQVPKTGVAPVERSPLDGLIYPNYSNPHVLSSGGVFRCKCERLRAPLATTTDTRVGHQFTAAKRLVYCPGPLCARPETGPWRRDGTVAPPPSGGKGKAPMYT